MHRTIFAILLAVWAASSAARTAPHKNAPPAIGHMAPSDIPDMPYSDTIRDYGDWTVQQSTAFVAAMTYSDEGGMFGLFCGKTCSYYTNPGLPCRIGSVTAGLFNGPNGAIPITLRCLHVKEEGAEEEFMLIDEDLTDLLDGASRVSITIPLQDGTSHVDIYSMKGAEDAQQDMLQRAVVYSAPPGPTI
jgi:hypothetical protein